MSNINPNLLSDQELQLASSIAEKIMDGVSQRVVGQEHLRKRLLTALITGGHILLEGVPGLAKTLSIKAVADTVGAKFKRIQFTPDLLPADIVGTEIYRPSDGKFEVRLGPVFANLILADEINRAPAKVQSALLETMQEHQVTIGDKTYQIPEPFFVMATQNPVEQEGTYPLPEAQIDRFMMKVKVGYPKVSDEKQILDLVAANSDFDHQPLNATSSLDEIVQVKSMCERVYVDDKVRQYIVNLVAATRQPEEFKIPAQELIELGASPRATISFFHCARAEAILSGMNYVTPQHVKDVAYDVLRHRIMLSYEAEAQGLSTDDVISIILEGVEVP